MLVKSEMEYKASFILTMIGSMISTFTSILSMLFLINRFGEVAGWTMNEIILITGIALFGHSFTEIVFQGLNHLYMKLQKECTCMMKLR